MDIGSRGLSSPDNDLTAGIQVQSSSVQGIRNALAAKLPELPVTESAGALAVTTQVSMYCNSSNPVLHFWLGTFAWANWAVPVSLRVL